MFWSKENIYTKKRLIITLTVLVMLISAAAAYSVVSVPTFTSGTTISSSQMNANFKTLGDRMGAYNYTSSSGVYVTNTGTVSPYYQDLAAITITAPAAGYIAVTGSAYYFRLNVGAASSSASAYLCLSATSGSCYQVQYFYATTYGMTAAKNEYLQPNLHYYFYVGSAGTYTYYLTGYRDTNIANGNPYLSSPRMTAMYFPSWM